jgi:phage terminase large subunit-like protein
VEKTTNPQVRSRKSKAARGARSKLSSSRWAKFAHRVDLYARRVLGDVTAGDPILAGPLVTLACKRHLKDRRRAVWTFNAEEADRWFAFYENVLRLADSLDERGDPKPFILEPALAFIIGSLVGWQGPDGYRRFREGYCEMGKGNGKTPLLAGLGLGGLLIDGEAAPEIYSVAVDRDQAKIMHRDAERMVAASPELAGLIKQTVNNLSYGLGFFRPFSREQGAKSGLRPHMALVDELHEHRSAEVVNKQRAGFKFRKQPLEVAITNSGFDRTSICWQRRQHAENVLRGLVSDDRHFAYVCALDEDDDPLTDEACWLKANPLLGVTIQLDYLRRQVENAKNIPAELNTVLRLNFCVWTNAETRAIDLGLWAACKPMPSDDYLRGFPCFGGLDLGMTDDLSAFVAVWELPDYYVVKARFWIPEGALTKFPNRPYDQWRRAGVLEITTGNKDTTDYDRIEDDVAGLCAEWGVREIGYDRRFSERMAQHLIGRGTTMVDTPQGFALNESIRTILKTVRDGTIAHGNDPVLSWMAGNVVTREGMKGDIRIDKESSPEKIDGIAALANAFDRIVRQPLEPKSVYENRGVLSV